MKYLDCKEKLNRWSKATYQVLYFVFWPICFPEIILYIAVSWKELIKYFIFLVWWSELCLRVRVGCRRFPHFKQFFLTGQPFVFFIFFKTLGWGGAVRVQGAFPVFHGCGEGRPHLCVHHGGRSPRFHLSHVLVWTQCGQSEWGGAGCLHGESHETLTMSHHETKLNKSSCLSLSGKIIWHSCGIQCWVLSLSP